MSNNVMGNLLFGALALGGAALLGAGVVAAAEAEAEYQEALRTLEKAGGKWANAAHYAKKANRRYRDAQREEEGFDRYELRRAQDYAEDAIREIRKAKTIRPAVREAASLVKARMERIEDARMYRR